MRDNNTLTKHRRNGIAMFKDYSVPQDMPPRTPPRDRGQEVLSSPSRCSHGPQIPVARSLEEGVVGEGTFSSTDVCQDIPLQEENFEEGEGEEEEEKRTNRIEALLNRALTWLGVGGLFNFPIPKEPRHKHQNPPIIDDLLSRVDELLDEIQNHELYHGHPDRNINSEHLYNINNPTRPPHRYTHPQSHPRISHPPRRVFSLDLSRTLGVLEEEEDDDESISDCDSDQEYEEGDGCALSLLELGTPLPPLPLKWSRAIMEVKPLFIHRNKTPGKLIPRDDLLCHSKRITGRLPSLPPLGEGLRASFGVGGG